MRRRSIVLSALSGAVAAMMVARERGAAQVATPAPVMEPATHPMVGAWKWANDPSDPHQESFAIFHADGTYVEVVGKETGIGVWQPTSASSAALTAYYQDLVPETVEVEPSRTTVQASIYLDA